VMPTDPEKIYDLDNIVCMSDSESNVNLNKLIIGFISDVVGPVSMPLYCVSFYKNFSTVLTEN
jgi:rRNA processing protein Gar1